MRSKTEATSQEGRRKSTGEAGFQGLSDTWNLSDKSSCPSNYVGEGERKQRGSSSHLVLWYDRENCGNLYGGHEKSETCSMLIGFSSSTCLCS